MAHSREQSIDPARGDNRSSSAEAYLTPVEDSRENWTVLVEHMVHPLADIGVTTDDYAGYKNTLFDAEIKGWAAFGYWH